MLFSSLREMARRCKGADERAFSKLKWWREVRAATAKSRFKYPSSTNSRFVRKETSSRKESFAICAIVFCKVASGPFSAFEKEAATSAPFFPCKKEKTKAPTSPTFNAPLKINARVKVRHFFTHAAPREV